MFWSWRFWLFGWRRHFTTPVMEGEAWELLFSLGITTYQREWQNREKD